MFFCYEAQHSTAQHSTAQHSTAQHSTAQHSTTKQQTMTIKTSSTALSRGELLQQTQQRNLLLEELEDNNQKELADALSSLTTTSPKEDIENALKIIEKEGVDITEDGDSFNCSLHQKLQFELEQKKAELYIADYTDEAIKAISEEPANQDKDKKNLEKNIRDVLFTVGQCARETRFEKLRQPCKRKVIDHIKLLGYDTKEVEQYAKDNNKTPFDLRAESKEPIKKFGDILFSLYCLENAPFLEYDVINLLADKLRRGGNDLAGEKFNKLSRFAPLFQ